MVDISSSLLASAVVILLAPGLVAQDPIYSFPGGSTKDYAGSAVNSAGDFNGDGIREIVVGAYGDDSAGKLAGSATVYSGLGGVRLYTFLGSSVGAGFGRAVAAAGDVNGDGFGDLIVGAPLDNSTGWAAGSAWVYSGWDGSLLRSIYGDGVGDDFGRAVCGLGDLDGDGFGDFLVAASETAYGGGGNGYARVYSGVDGSLLHSLVGGAALDGFGISAAPAGDLDHDGLTDFVVGADKQDGNGSAAGAVYAYSGATAALLFTAFGDAAGDGFGGAVAGGRDFSGDGVPDLVVGAPQVLSGGAGYVRVLSGAGGAPLYTLRGVAAHDKFGRAVAVIGDADGDGDPDLAVGTTESGNGLRAGSVRVYDGASGAHVYSVHGAAAGDQLGHSLAGVGDLDFNGKDDLLLGAPYADVHGADSGQALVVGHSSPTLIGPFPGTAGSVNTLHASGLPANAKVYFLHGSTRGLTPSPSCASLFADLADPKVISSSNADALGNAFVSGHVPGGMAGTTLLLQAFAPAACKVSNLVVKTF